jgi:hypothetical protein
MERPFLTFEGLHRLPLHHIGHSVNQSLGFHLTSKCFVPRSGSFRKTSTLVMLETKTCEQFKKQVAGCLRQVHLDLLATRVSGKLPNERGKAFSECGVERGT